MYNILFILGKFFPKGSANGVCCKNLVDELVKQGHHVTCIINADVTRPRHEEIDGIEVFRVKPRLYYRILDWCEYNEGSIWGKTLRLFANFINKLQLAIMSPFWPFVSPFYTYRFYKQGRKLLKSKHYDIVISVYTPIDSALAGHLLKKKFPKVKFVLYYLDALAGGWGPVLWSKDRIEKHTRYWEKMINSNADVVISMLSSKSYHDEHPVEGKNRRNYLDVPTFVESPIFSDSSEKSDRIIALYAGSIHYPDRNPIPLLEAFVSICSNNNIEFRLIGPCNCQQIIEKYSRISNGKIKYLGVKSHDDTLAEEAKADFLVNFGSINPNTIPCKIFEYMQLGKPIISTCSIGKEPSIVYFKKYSSSFIFDERIATDKSHIDLLNYILSNPKMENLDYSKIFYKNTPKAFCDVINTL